MYTIFAALVSFEEYEHFVVVLWFGQKRRVLAGANIETLGSDKLNISPKKFALITWLVLVSIQPCITISTARLPPFISITQQVHSGPGTAYLHVVVAKIRNLNDKLKKIMAIINLSKSRNSRPEVFCKKGVFKHFKKLIGKRLCRSLFLIKIEVLGLPLY